MLIKMPALLAFFLLTKGIFMGTHIRLILALSVLFIMGCNNREIIVEGLTQDDANEILVALWDHHIDATKEGHPNRKNINYDIIVKKKHAHAALRILVVNQLPKSKRAGLKEVYPPGSAGIIPTKSDEQARLIMALQGEIEALIKALPQIVDAHVVLSMDQSHELSKTASSKSASLTITYRPDPDDEALPISESELQNLVSSAVGGLNTDSVRVIMKPLKPVKFLSPQEPTLPEFLPETIKPKQSNLIWPLLTLLILALITSSYALLRPRLKSLARS